MKWLQYAQVTFQTGKKALFTQKDFLFRVKKDRILSEQKTKTNIVILFPIICPGGFNLKKSFLIMASEELRKLARYGCMIEMVFRFSKKESAFFILQEKRKKKENVHFLTDSIFIYFTVKF
jgi:hypothetical protein